MLIRHASINPLVARLAAPPIPEAHGWARRYDGSHGPLIDLSQAAPGSAPHPALLEKLAEFAGSPASARYGPIVGDDALRGGYAKWVSQIYGGTIRAEDVAITTGCNEAFVAAAMLAAGHGQAVALPAPWYFNHQMTLAMLGIEARPLPCRAQNGFVPTVSDTLPLLDESVRALVLVTPNNPTGAIYPPETIGAFARACRERDIWLILDETYRDFLPDGAGAPHDLFAGQEWRSNVIQLYSFSKSFAVPGHRIGALVADAPIVAELGKILDSVQICAPRAAQAALAWAIPSLGAWRSRARDDILERAEAFRALMHSRSGWRIDSIGAYFAYLRHPFRSLPAALVTEALACERGVLCLPGSFFGPRQEDHLRVAFANVGLADIGALAERLEGFAPGA